MSRRSARAVSWLSLLLLAILVLMLVGHLGRPSWYWFIVPAAGCSLNLWVDLKRHTRQVGVNRTATELLPEENR